MDWFRDSYDTILDELKTIWRHVKRNYNKWHGRPATPNVGVVGNLIIQLRAAVEQHLGHPISTAVIARPNLPGLPREDLEDAMEYAGLRTLHSYYSFGDISETAAAAAGMSLGLCSNYANIKACEDEQPTFPLHHIIAVTFTHYSLDVTYATFQKAYWSDEHKAERHFDLGFSFSNASDYWSSVQKAIRDVALVCQRPLTNLFLMGEEAANEDFLDAVRDALYSLIPSVGPLTDFDPLFVVAKGAAEFAKRFQETPWNCLEQDYCKKNRIPEAGIDGRKSSRLKGNERLLHQMPYAMEVNLRGDD